MGNIASITAESVGNNPANLSGAFMDLFDNESTPR